MDCTATCHLTEHADLVLSAITREDLSTFQKISKRVCANGAQIRDLVGRNALHVAASCNRSDILEWLVKECGVDIELRDAESGWSALHRSLYYGHLKCTVDLVKVGRLAAFAPTNPVGWGIPVRLVSVWCVCLVRLVCLSSPSGLSV